MKAVTVLILTAVALLQATSLLANSPDSLCEFERPQLTHDYWPVFLKDPETGNGSYPVLDIFVNKEGKADQFAVLNSQDDTVRAILASAAQLMKFQPAFACGEVVDGFFRYPIKSYFYLEEKELETITTAPATGFMITPELQSTLELAAYAIDEDVLHFELEVSPEGKVEEIRGVGSRWAKRMAKNTFKEVASRFVFRPALNGEEPVPFRLHWILRISESATNRIFEEPVSSASKPLPEKPESGPVIIGEPLSVELTFYPDGHMRDIQYLTVMNETESLAALAAFRKWRIEPVEDDDYGQLMRTVTYVYTEDSDSAVLIEESVRPSITRPVLKKRVMPQYPRKLLQKGVVGTVALTFVVDKEGKVQDVEVTSATHRDFAASVLQVTDRWRFEPARLKDEPINSRWRLVIPFKI